MPPWLVAAVTGPALLLGGVDAGDRARPGRDRTTRPASRGSTTRPAPSASSTPWSGASTGRSTAPPGGATVRLAAYSFAMPSTAQALRRAHRRGVRVQVVVDDRSAQWGSVRGAAPRARHQHPAGTASCGSATTPAGVRPATSTPSS